ncbi:MAG: N-acetylneuraminate synthase family protein [Phycisphaerae bacterium]|nr:N-acetylneuraminate synthase family protein [Phycisphaerae bacterium]
MPDSTLLPQPTSTDRPEPAPVRIGSAEVGPGRRACVIAEAGVNHNGSEDAAHRMIDAALAAGADAVKFQAFRAADLATPDANAASYQKTATGTSSQRTMLESLELPADAFERLAHHCRRDGIEFLATPFGVRDLHMLRNLGMRAVKIASTDLNNLPLLDEVIATRLPIILSTGATLPEELDTTVQRLRERRAADRLILLHCVSSYPTPWSQANLRRIPHLKARYGLPTGFSDHTQAIQTGALAVAAGACVIEKHFTLDSRLPGPDQSLSLEPGLLAEYVEQIRDAEAALGTGDLTPRECELDVRQVARKSIVAARPIAAGEILDATCLTTKRPAGGLEPHALPALLGKRARTPIPADTRITWDMVE